MSLEKVNYEYDETHISSQNLNDIQDAIIELQEQAILTGIAITQNADLDNYTTAGQYYAANGTIASSLTNCPYTSSGFVMDVALYGTLPVQTIHTGNRIYERRKGSTWGAWNMYLPSNRVINTAITSDMCVNIQTPADIGARIDRDGNVCVLRLISNVKPNTSTSGWSVLFTLPSGYTPSYRTNALIMNDTDGVVTECRVLDDGFSVYKPVAGKSYWGSIAYIV